MRKNLKFVISFCGICFLIFACQKESINDLQEISQEKKLKRISLNELNSRIGNSKDYSKLSPLFDINNSKANGFQKRLENSDNPYLVTDEIAVVEKEQATFYTFKILSDTTGDEFYNFVVAMDEFNNIRSTRILEYIPSISWLNDTSQPFNGEVKIHKNNIFSTNDISNILSRGSNSCVTDVSGKWQCNKGNNHSPTEGTSCTSWEFIITIHWGPCNNTIDNGGGSGGGGVTFPVDGGNTGGGGPSNGGSGDNNNGGNPPDDGEDCILDSNGNCLTDETTPLPPGGNNTEIPVDLCDEKEKISDLIDNSSIDYQQLLTSIAGFANTNSEVSVTIDTQDQVNPQDGVQGSGGTDIDTNPANSYVSIIHTHDAFGLDSDGDGIGTGTYSVFSFEDLMVMAETLHNNKLNSGTFVAFLITAKGTRYALTINDPTKFLNLFYYKIVDIPSTPEEAGRWTLSKENLRPLFKEYYDPNNNDRKIKASDTDNDNVLKEFLSFLNEADAGISLFEANPDFDSFQPLKLNLLSSEPDRTTNCNN